MKINAPWKVFFKLKLEAPSGPDPAQVRTREFPPQNDFPALLSENYLQFAAFQDTLHVILIAPNIHIGAQSMLLLRRVGAHVARFLGACPLTRNCFLRRLLLNARLSKSNLKAASRL